MKNQSSKALAVIGLGFGDEGKGVTVDSLCQHLGNRLVVRYSGGQQAGHTVTRDDGVQHVFSNFGSGTFRGAPTYWSSECTFDPVGVVNELRVLLSKGVQPKLFVSADSPVTTPYDICHNQASDELKKNGTCGVGVGSTFAREEAMYSLKVGDLRFPSVLETKLKMISNYYNIGTDISSFMESVDIIKNGRFIEIVDKAPSDYDTLIFESSQGLLLDQNIGFFPHVTRSNVGSKTIIENGFEPHLFLVTRAFQTRHGNGPMTYEYTPHNIKYNKFETNESNKYQGHFRRAILDLDLLKYGISKDDYIRETKNKELVITCMDLVKDEYKYAVDGKIVQHSTPEEFARAIADHLGIDKVHMIASPCGTNTLL